MKLSSVLAGVKIICASSDWNDIDVSDVSSDSRLVKPGVLFVAVRGSRKDGHKYVNDAISQKAAAVIVDERSCIPAGQIPVPVVCVENSKLALAKILDNFFGSPYKKIKFIGITGTNGKTTVSFLIRSILQAAGSKCGLIGTIGARINEENVALSNTTPGICELHKIVSDMVRAGNDYVAMEVSSHALDQGRVDGVIFDAAIFTNLTQDHLDYHQTMEAYYGAKEKLFKNYVDKNSSLIINIDDKFGSRLYSGLQGRGLSYGFSPKASVSIERYSLSPRGCEALLRTPRGGFEISTRLVGKHNLYNILASIAFGISQGFENAVLKGGIEAVERVCGRLERLESLRGFSVFVDYAHTDDALKNVLESLRHIIHNGRIITVFGCGGDRDRGKRPKMGRVAASLSDFCIVTTDNPRNEEPQAIIREILSGIEDRKNFFVEEDREKAIRRALDLAQKGDIVLVAGKGHEAYQIVKDRVLDFDDLAVVSKILKEQEGHV